MKPPTITPKVYRSAASIVGLLLIAAGVGALSIPASAIVVGTVLFSIATHASYCALKTPD